MNFPIWRHIKAAVCAKSYFCVCTVDLAHDYMSVWRLSTYSYDNVHFVESKFTFLKPASLHVYIEVQQNINIWALQITNNLDTFNLHKWVQIRTTDSTNWSMRQKPNFDILKVGNRNNWNFVKQMAVNKGFCLNEITSIPLNIHVNPFSSMSKKWLVYPNAHTKFMTWQYCTVSICDLATTKVFRVKSKPRARRLKAGVWSEKRSKFKLECAAYNGFTCKCIY